MAAERIPSIPAGGPLTPALAGLSEQWRMRAAEFRRWGAEPNAVTLERAAEELDAVLRESGGQFLTLTEASRRCGYTDGHMAASSSGVRIRPRAPLRYLAHPPR